jgi:Secretion system C-terminal sorting domain
MKKIIIFGYLFLQFAIVQGASIKLSKVSRVGNVVTFDVTLITTASDPTIYLGNFDISLNSVTSASIVSAARVSSGIIGISPTITSIGFVGRKINFTPDNFDETNFATKLAIISPNSSASLGRFSITYSSPVAGTLTCGGVSLFNIDVTPDMMGAYAFLSSQVPTSCATDVVSLPLELLSFSASANNKSEKTNVLTSWSTASEENVEGFNIERSEDSKTFEKVGYVKSAGTSRGTYNFTDEVPLSGVNYYRLKMMNTDGSFTYSPVRSVTLAESKTTGLSVSPNPAKEAVFVKLNAKEAKTMTLELVDVAGKVLLTEKKKVEIGFNQLSLNLSGYPAGLYFLKVGDATTSEMRRVVIAE